MDGAFYADTARLAQHRDILLEERRTAQRLCEHLRHARRYALPEDIPYYDRLIGKADHLAAYFRAMADQVDIMGIELERLSLQIAMLLEDGHC